MLVFASAPQLIAPFSESDAADPLRADRVATDLAESTFVDTPSSTQINTTAATAFFDEPDDVHTTVGLDTRTPLNISVVSTESGEPLSSNGVEYTFGEPVPERAGQVSVTQRVLQVDDESYWLSVRVW
ncbi:hypothetical protein EA462_07405 [Natrarchaeobius halalkaliphilus]|uniref:Uncharacterized protein n=2 Tax=Natrarchaeobius halalkaliphilus TaxID=1679091 RepID=A0A3N6M8P4_9EURY|nr:hypothetical protein EA462_07405 [Natrarchaeobius halalkaliphilus]